MHGHESRIPPTSTHAFTHCVQRHTQLPSNNENTNGLVRQYLPKGTDLSIYSQELLDAIADAINNRPRKGLGVRSPLSVYRELLINSPQHSTLIH